MDATYPNQPRRNTHNPPRRARLPRATDRSDRPRAQHPRCSVSGACEHGGGGEAERRAGARGRRQPTETRLKTSRPDKREHPGAPTKGNTQVLRQPDPTTRPDKSFKSRRLRLDMEAPKPHLGSLFRQISINRAPQSLNTPFIKIARRNHSQDRRRN